MRCPSRFSAVEGGLEQGTSQVVVISQRLETRISMYGAIILSSQKLNHSSPPYNTYTWYSHTTHDSFPTRHTMINVRGDNFVIKKLNHSSPLLIINMVFTYSHNNTAHGTLCISVSHWDSKLENVQLTSQKKKKISWTFPKIKERQREIFERFFRSFQDFLNIYFQKNILNHEQCEHHAGMRCQ